MWSFLTPLLIGRATGGWRLFRAALLIILVGCVILGVIYATIVFRAIGNTPEKHHVQPHTSH